jgi:hypothetical protein
MSGIFRAMEIHVGFSFLSSGKLDRFIERHVREPHQLLSGDERRRSGSRVAEGDGKGTQCHISDGYDGNLLQP